jgi:H+/gluconate symporter-like permease
MTLRRWIEYLVAVLVGNAIYFLILFPDLPPSLQHEPFGFDLGLLLAFVCCVAVYGVIRLGSLHARRMYEKR